VEAVAAKPLALALALAVLPTVKVVADWDTSTSPDDSSVTLYE
jgi:hypothetical protein